MLDSSGLTNKVFVSAFPFPLLLTASPNGCGNLQRDAEIFISSSDHVGPSKTKVKWSRRVRWVVGPKKKLPVSWAIAHQQLQLLTLNDLLVRIGMNQQASNSCHPKCSLFSLVVANIQTILGSGIVCLSARSPVHWRMKFWQVLTFRSNGDGSKPYPPGEPQNSW